MVDKHFYKKLNYLCLSWFFKKFGLNIIIKKIQELDSNSPFYPPDPIKLKSKVNNDEIFKKNSPKIKEFLIFVKKNLNVLL